MKYSLLGILFVLMGFVLFSNPPAKKWKSLHGITVGKENEKDENPLARQEYEFRMLRDPKTNSIPKNIRQRELDFAKRLPVAEAVRLQKGMQKIEALSWSSLGPANRGGRTRAMAIDVSNENDLLAGGVSGGMWISTDDGTTWKKTTQPQQLQSVSCIAQDTRAGHTNVFYYGTGEGTGNSADGGGDSPYRGNGIYKSVDGGFTWNVLPSTANTTPQTLRPFDYVWNIAVDPSRTNEDVIYAALLGGVVRSSDGGQTWTTVLGDMQSSTYTDVVVTNSGVVYAALSNSNDTASGIWRSATGLPGSFEKITPAAWPSAYNRIVLGLAPSDQSVLYVLAETPGGGKLGHSLWKYTDGAANPWDDRSNQIPELGGSNGNFDSQNSYDLLIKVKPDDENFVVIGGTNLYRSTDGFATAIDTNGWIGGYALSNNNSSYANQHSDEHSLVFMPSNPKIMYSGNDGGISKTVDNTATPVVWTKADNGYITSQFYSVALDMSASNDNQVLGGLQDNGNYLDISNQTPASWEKLPFGGDGGITAIANNKTSYYIETQNGEVIRLITDANGQLQDFATVKPKGGSNFLFIAPFVLDPNNSNVMYMPAGDTLWRNSDLTAIPTQSQDPTDVNWIPIANPNSTGDVISAVAVSKNPANVVYFGNAGGKVYKIQDGSVTNPVITDITGADFPQNAYVSSIAVDPENANDVMVVFSNYSVISLYYSNDGGGSWTAVAGNLEENTDGSGNGPSCRWASILHNNNLVYYFVATSTGIYSTPTLNGMNTVWAQEGAGSIGNIVCTMVQTRNTDGKVVVATHGNGVYASYMSTVDVKNQDNNLPLTFNLSQNYPNPFNPSTNIKYSLPSSSNVVLKIYDVSGKEVKTLISSEQPAGVHNYSFNASDLASGIYFYSLRAGKYTQTRKMILMK